MLLLFNLAYSIAKRAFSVNLNIHNLAIVKNVIRIYYTKTDPNAVVAWAHGVVGDALLTQVLDD